MNMNIPTSTSKSIKNIKSGILDSSRTPSLQKKLESSLPYSIPLWERINFHFTHEPISETSKIFVATCISDDDIAVEGSPSELSIDEWLRQDTTTTTTSNPWLAAHIDLVNYGQTQVWLFSSWEYDVHQQQEQQEQEQHTSEYTQNDDDQIDPTHEALVQSLFTYIYTTLIPEMPMTTPPPEWTTLLRTGKTLTTPYSRNKVIFGTVGDKLWKYFPTHSRTRTDPNYVKYIFEETEMDVASLRREKEEENDKISRLPHNYKFTTLSSKHLQIVLDRSTIPRTLSTLSEFVNVGVLYTADPKHDDDNSNKPDNPDSNPIAWGFLGKDSSISSLHTEPQHRGKGLALFVARELLMRRHRQQHNQQQAGNTIHQHQHQRRGPSPTSYYWAHADVSKSNMPSRRVMEKLGGKPMWMVMWTELDLEKIFQPSAS